MRIRIVCLWHLNAFMIGSIHHINNTFHILSFRYDRTTNIYSENIYLDPGFI